MVHCDRPTKWMMCVICSSAKEGLGIQSSFEFLTLILSSTYVQANLAFCAKLVRGIAPLPMVGPKVRFLTSGTASANFQSKASRVIKGAASVSSLRDGIPEDIEEGDVVLLVQPSVRQDYLAAQKIASDGIAGGVVLVNALAKVRIQKENS